jgi:hypothetical protein
MTPRIRSLAGAIGLFLGGAYSISREGAEWSVAGVTFGVAGLLVLGVWVALEVQHDVEGREEAGGGRGVGDGKDRGEGAA